MTVAILAPGRRFVWRAADASAVLRERPETREGPCGDAASEMAELLRGSRGRGGAWVLDSRAFRQTVRLPARQAAGLSDEELSSALAFETEPFSGLPSGSSETAWTRAPSSGTDAAFDVVQVSRDGLKALAKAVASAGGRLAGLSGLPEGFDPSDVSAAAAAAAAVVSGEAPSVAPRRPRFAAWRLPAAAGAAALRAVAAVMGPAAASAVAEAREARRETEARRELRRRVAAAEDALRAARRADPGPGANASGSRAAGRAAWAALLAELPRAFDGLAAVRSMSSPGPGEVRVEALAPGEAQQREAVSALAAALGARGWTVEPESAGPARPGDASSPWAFSARLSLAGGPGEGIR